MRQREKDRLNKQAATLIMGWIQQGNGWVYSTNKQPVWQQFFVNPVSGDPFPAFNPAEDLTHAWMVVEKMRERDVAFIKTKVSHKHSEEWLLFGKLIDMVFVWYLPESQAAAEITKAAIQAHLESHLKRVERMSTK